VPHNEQTSTIGVVHWGALDVYGDGEGLHLVIPAYFEPHHVPYLDGVLESRLPDVFGRSVTRGPAVGNEENGAMWFRLDPGERHGRGGGATYEEGSIVIGPVSQPWPDAAQLRKVLEEAFVEAGEVEAEQRGLAEQLVRHLRAAREQS
jgi:hypothetical protein